MRILRSQRGDTIIEVLIAIAVVSLLLVSAYSLTNKNVATMQNVQEQGEAQKIAEQQVERFRLYLGDKTALASVGGCINGSGAMASGASCVVNADDTVVPVSSNRAAYKKSIKNTDSPNVYEIAVEWTAAGGIKGMIAIYYYD